MILYKYRNFDPDGYWRRIFTTQEFWFSIPANLDDEEEVAINWNVPPHYREDGFEAAIRQGCGILSLGKTPTNDDLWNRYGGNGSICDRSGFCVEVDFTDFVNREDLFFTDVHYIGQPATVDIDFDLIQRFSLGEQQVIDEVWRKLYFQKNIEPWEAQDECRFLHHNHTPPSGYRGMALSLPKEAILKVFFVEGKMHANDLEQLRAAAEICGSHVLFESLRL